LRIQRHPSVTPFRNTPERHHDAPESDRHAASHRQRIDARIIDVTPPVLEVHVRLGDLASAAGVNNLTVAGSPPISDKGNTEFRGVLLNRHQSPSLPDLHEKELSP
jgi:hypothetical protein